MYIAPNTNVKILRDIKLDSSYINTAYWECFSPTSLKKRSSLRNAINGQKQ